MSTSLVSFLTLVGKSATEAEVACDDLLARRVERQPSAFGSEDWSAVDRAAIDDACSSLVRAGTALPVVYYSQYLDGWSVGNSSFDLLVSPDGRRRQLCGERYGLVYYPSGLREDLLAQIARYRRRRLYRTQSEDRWFLDQAREAINAALWIGAPFLVLSISQVLGPSRLDEEIEAAVNLSLPSSSSSPSA